MNTPIMIRNARAIFTRCLQTLIVKGKDYASDSDALENFKRQADSTGLTKYQIWSVFAEKHRSAIVNAIRENPESPQCHSELLSDRVMDLVNYLLLLECMRIEDGTAVVKTPSLGVSTVCLIGSTKFKDEFAAVNAYETLRNNIVLAPGVFAHADGMTLETLAKEQLDELHMRKIDMCDRVWLIDVDEYVGQSTQRELDYAVSLGLPILRWSENADEVLTLLSAFRTKIGNG